MRHLAIIVAILFPLVCWGQNHENDEKPAWTNGYFSEQPNSYIEVVSATGYSEDNARNKAAQVVVERRSLATGQRNTIDIRNGNIVISGQDDLTVKSRIIDQYTEHTGSGEYRVSLLVQTTKNPELPYEQVHVTNHYGFSPRVFVPGMAQLHKGQTLKGTLFIAGEVVALAGVFAFEGLRSSYASKINRTHNADEIQNYINKEKNMSNVRNGFIVGAAAIYVWNVIDGIVSKGKKHIEIGDVNMTFAPYSDLKSAGVLLSLTF